jgi:hypothetical protein
MFEVCDDHCQAFDEDAQILHPVQAFDDVSSLGRFLMSRHRLSFSQALDAFP